MQMQDVTQIIARASADAAFRADLLKNPRAVFDRAGVTLPAEVSLKVFENDAETFHAVLPVPEGPQVLEFVRQANPVAAKVYERAWKDAAFKQRLMTQPRQAFAEATGVTPPAGMRLVAHEDTAQVINVVVPYVPRSGELSDVDLEQVAGGKGSVSRCNNAMAEVGGTGAEITIDATAGSIETGPGAAIVFGLGALATGVAVAGTAIASVAK